jgi:hypothetical protein
VSFIHQDVVDKYMFKAVEKKMDALSLVSMKMKQLPDISIHVPFLQCLTHLNLSKNQLFNGDDLFRALAGLQQLTQLNLSENFLNGVLSEHAGRLQHLEVLNLDINNISMLSPAVKNWTRLKIFTASDNSLIGMYGHGCVVRDADDYAADDDDDDMMMMEMMVMMMMEMMVMIAYRHPPGSLCLDRHQHRELQEQQDH